MDLQTLIERRANVWSQMQAIYERAQDGQLSAEDNEQYDRLEAELDGLSAQIQRAERHAQRGVELSAVRSETRVLAGGDRVVERSTRVEATAEYRSAWEAYMRFGLSEMTPEQRGTLRQGFRRDDGAGEQRAQTVSTTGGGYLIPTEFQAELIRAMLAFGGVRANARVIETDSGATLYVPTVDDTSNTGRLLAINTAVTTTDVAFGQKQLDAYKYSSDQVLVPVELMQDSAFALDAFIRDILAERLGRITESHYTTGTGSSQPNGVVTASTQGKVGATGQTTSVIADDLVDLYHAIDPSYRPGSAWMMNDATVKAIRKLKTGVSGDNTYLWQPGLANGEPDQLLGRPVIVNQQVATMAANAKSILFGNFQRYWIRDIRGIRVIRMDERYADVDQVGFVAFLRTDGELIGPSGSIKHYANSAT